MRTWRRSPKISRAWLQGSDAGLRRIRGISAHFGSPGDRRAVNGDKIYNGAMDDASGDCLVLEMRAGSGNRARTEEVDFVFGGDR